MQKSQKQKKLTYVSTYGAIEIRPLLLETATVALPASIPRKEERQKKEETRPICIFSEKPPPSCLPACLPVSTRQKSN